MLWGGYKKTRSPIEGCIINVQKVPNWVPNLRATRAACLQLAGVTGKTSQNQQKVIGNPCGFTENPYRHRKAIPRDLQEFPKNHEESLGIHRNHGIFQGIPKDSKGFPMTAYRFLSIPRDSLWNPQGSHEFTEIPCEFLGLPYDTVGIPCILLGVPYFPRANHRNTQAIGYPGEPSDTQGILDKKMFI